MSAYSQAARPAILLGSALAAALLAWLILRGKPERASDPRTPQTRRAAPTSTDRDPASGPATPTSEPVADDGPGAPHVPADAPQIPNLMQLRPQAAARLRKDVARWLITLGEVLRRRDWDTLRKASRAMQKTPQAYAGLVSEALAGSKDPQDALIAGLLFETHIEQGALPPRLVSMLGDQVVPPLADALRGDRLTTGQKHHALRVLSRFPGESSRLALIGVVKDDRMDTEMKRFALFGLATIGGRSDAETLRPLLGARQPELVRIAALALGKIALRTRQPQLLAEIRPRLQALLRTAVERGDGRLFDNVVSTAATLREQDAAAYLATHVLDNPTLPDKALQTALQRLVSLKAVGQLPALTARRGRLGSTALNDALESAIARLRQLK